jgi:hypothetical protein
MLSECLTGASSNDLGFWLFADNAGDPPHPNTVSHRWRTLRKKAGGLIAACCMW